MWLLISIILFLPSLLLVLKAPTNFLWKLSVLFTEWGYCFGLLSIVLVLILRGEDPVAFSLLLIASCLYVYPLFVGVWIGSNLSNKLTSSFGIEVKAFQISFSSLFQLAQSFGITPSTHVYYESKDNTLEFDF